MADDVDGVTVLLLLPSWPLLVVEVVANAFDLGPKVAKMDVAVAAGVVVNVNAELLAPVGPPVAADMICDGASMGERCYFGDV